MTDAQREREYSPSSCLPDGDYRPFVAAYRSESDSAWATVEAAAGVRTTTVTYGDAASNTVDVVVPVATDPPPLLVYFHGGYWQELSKHESRFAAVHCVDRGWAFAAVDYTLAPDADLDEIVRECRQAVRAVGESGSSLGIDPRRIVVAGSSAGAHLAAMTASGPSSASHRIIGAVLVSGIFELEPLIGTSIDDALGLDADMASRNSPMALNVAEFPTALLAYGEHETGEFKAQTEQFADRLVAAGVRATTLEVPDRNHFDVILDLAAPDTLLGEATAILIGAAGTGPI